MKETGIDAKVLKAGEANMFLSKVFRQTLSNVTGAVIKLYNTDGSVGAARGAGIGCGFYKSPAEAFSGLKTMGTTEPSVKDVQSTEEIYQRWKKHIDNV
jgi:xylulokinase